MAAYEKPPQVFMNFRGAELRQSFISHLEVALKRSGVNVYVDHVELIGKDLDFISKGINESRIAVVIFSERYTASSWCLDELVKIKERVKEGKLIAIPIYYKLNPSQVRSLDGEFGFNLWNHVKHTSKFDKLNKWKEALDFFSQKRGLVFNEKSTNEFMFINDITSHVHRVLTSDDDLYLRKDDDFVVETNPTMVTLPKHQVFISFPGNMLDSFIGHLVGALRRNGVSICFADEQLTGLNDAKVYEIEESRIALVIFSSEYAESTWCLEELVKIKEFMEKGKLVAIPIFYKVQPSQVTDLMGEFGDNFKNMNRNRNANKWKEALKSVSSRMGIYVKENSSKHEIISSIVTNTLRIISELGREKHETYVGIEQRMEQLEKKLEVASNDTRIIGVVGVPRIGKTTIAMMLFKKLKRRFTCSVSLLNIHKKSVDYGPLQLRKELLEDLLVGKFPLIEDKTTHGSMKMELLKTKIFLLLDDVTDKKQLEFLLGDLDWIKKGSMIVITTSDKSLLEGFAHDTYVVPQLNDREAFQLFSYHAFGDRICSPIGIFLTLSRVLVDYARGHPFVLEILGSGLHGRDEDHWTSILEMVTKESNMRLGPDWSIFTNHLDEKQKDVFLDIVFFFKSEDDYFVRSLLDSGDPVSDLVNKSLITITDGRVEMNVPLYMFFNNLDSRWRRLWNCTDIIKELMKMGKSGYNNVRGIFFDISKLKENLFLDTSTFINMHNLRYLKIYYSCCPPQCEADYELNFPDGLEFLLEEVRYLHWEKFPLEELPPDFRPANLVDLRLPYSKITRLWEGEKVTPRLKMVDLSHSRELLDLSALSNAENLQSLNLEGCTSLDEFPVKIQNIKCLVYLNLRGCISLWSLPKMNFISLKTLILSDCSNLEEFQLISESLEFLHLDGTAIKGLPPAIQNFQRLIVLNLKNCKMLECLPSCLGNLKALDKLILSGCSRLKNFPDVRNSLKHLRILLLDGTGAKEMPSISCFIGSEGPPSADMSCSVREWPSSLQRLCLSENDFVSLQFDIWKLYNLKWLDVKDCKKLISIPLLPPRLQYFDAHGCDSLQSVANPIACSVLPDQIHSVFNFSNCNSLDQDAKDSIISYTRWRSQLVLDEHKRYNGGLVLEALVGTCFPGWEVPAWFSHRAAGSVLNPKLPPHWFDNNFTGIGLCVVMVFDGSYNQREGVLVKCNCEFKNEDRTSIRFSCTVGGWGKPSNSPRNIVSSHVLIGFTSRMDIKKTSEEDDGGKCVFTETFIEFEVTDGIEKIRCCEVVMCGFTLVYAPQERANMARFV